MMIESRLSLQKIGRIKQRLFQMDLKALDAYSVESVEKGHLYGVYNHYLHYSIFVSASTRTTAVPATLFPQTWNGLVPATLFLKCLTSNKFPFNSV